MTRPQTPPPGSQSAMMLMPPLDTLCERCGGSVTLYVRPGGTVAWVMNRGRKGLHLCRVGRAHGTHPRENGAGDRPASPVRLAGDAWGCP